MINFSYLKEYGYYVYKEIGRGGYGVVYKACKIDSKEKLGIFSVNFVKVPPSISFLFIKFITIKDR